MQSKNNIRKILDTLVEVHEMKMPSVNKNDEKLALFSRKPRNNSLHIHKCFLWSTTLRFLMRNKQKWIFNVDVSWKPHEAKNILSRYFKKWNNYMERFRKNRKMLNDSFKNHILFSLLNLFEIKFCSLINNRKIILVRKKIVCFEKKCFLIFVIERYVKKKIKNWTCRGRKIWSIKQKFHGNIANSFHSHI